MTRAALLLLVTFGLAACQPAAPAEAPAAEAPAATAAMVGGAASNAEVSASGVTCRPTLNGRDVTACHLTLTATDADQLSSVASPLGKAEIHDMSHEGGVMRMAAMPDGVPLPAGEPVRLEPRGKHIMLMGLKQPLTAGQTVPLTLTFGSAPPLQVEAQVVAPAP